MNKKSLEISLSNLLPLKEFNVLLEQYPTSSKVAADLLWWAYLNGDITDKKVCDLGCGNGIFGCGAKLLGASSVVFVDVDSKAINIAKQNCSGRFLNCDVSDLKIKVDTVIMNPPFGVQNEHADRRFLLKAFLISKVIYSIHKIESLRFISELCKDNGFEVVDVKKFNFVLPKLYKFHTKKKYDVSVGCFLLRKV